jgi:hypothetical protein
MPFREEEEHCLPPNMQTMDGHEEGNPVSLSLGWDHFIFSILAYPFYNLPSFFLIPYYFSCAFSVVPNRPSHPRFRLADAHCTSNSLAAPTGNFRWPHLWPKVLILLEDPSNQSPIPLPSQIICLKRPIPICCLPATGRAEIVECRLPATTRPSDGNWPKRRTQTQARAPARAAKRRNDAFRGQRRTAGAAAES